MGATLMCLCQLFVGILKCYFGDDEKDRVLRDFMDRGTYDLCIEGETGTTRIDEWPRVRSGARIVMSVVIAQAYHLDQHYCCPRCMMLNKYSEVNDGWIDW
jgi:hypothetical protein